jgi:hypothetical protein
VEKLKMNYDLSKGSGADAQALAALALSAALLEMFDDKRGRAIVGSALSRSPKVGVTADRARRILDSLKRAPNDAGPFYTSLHRR